MATELAKKGHNVFVICRGLKRTYHYIEDDVHIFRVYDKNYNTFNGYFSYRKKVAKKICKLYKQYKIDLIETPDWGAETIFLKKHKNIPIIVRLHTPLKIWLDYNNNNFGKITNYMLKWENQNLQNADLITCCSHFLSNTIPLYFSLNKNLHVIYNPMNSKDFYLDKKVIKENAILFVGSLEERKGVLILAQALNLIFEKYPNLTMRFIGKDTTRNSFNESTKGIIYNIVKKQYHKNLLFLGQISNQKLNYFYNSSRVAIYPSLFDNLPYVVLEAMSTGIYVVGSQNSGMPEMLDDNQYIYQTGDYIDLAHKVLCAYQKSLTEPYNFKNICNVQKKFDSKTICNEMLRLYQISIIKHVTQKLLKKIDSTKITLIERINNGLANEVYKIETLQGKYILKKYLYNYNFRLENELYDIYEKNKIKVSRPLNQTVFQYNGNQYNIFNFLEGKINVNINHLDYFSKLLLCDRKVLQNASLINKCDLYYISLNKVHSYNFLSPKIIKYVLQEYEVLRKEKIFYDSYLNHGDISKSNIICHGDEKNLIDFDEVIITTELYDFAVIVVKHFVVDDKIDLSLYNQLIFSLKNKFKKYTAKDYYNSVRMYLIKILLEKFYLHCIHKINLFDKSQSKDDYRHYYNLLIYMQKYMEVKKYET